MSKYKRTGNPPGRRPIYGERVRPIDICLTHQQWIMLDSFAKELNLSRSSFVRKLLLDYDILQQDPTERYLIDYHKAIDRGEAPPSREIWEANQAYYANPHQKKNLEFLADLKAIDDFRAAQGGGPVDLEAFDAQKAAQETPLQREVRLKTERQLGIKPRSLPSGLTIPPSETRIESLQSQAAAVEAEITAKANNTPLDIDLAELEQERERERAETLKLLEDLQSGEAAPPKTPES